MVSVINLLTLNQLHNLQGPVKNENARHLIQKNNYELQDSNSRVGAPQCR